jgi:hypothetical protein
VSASPSETPRGRARLVRVGLLLVAVAAVAALGLLASGCGGSSGQAVAQVDTTQTTTTESDSGNGSSSDDPAAYSACMRKHGVPKFPDPDKNGGLRLKAGPGTGIDPESAQFKAAAKACAKLAPKAPSPAQRAKDQQQLLKFAACMRQHGLPKFPDPEPNGGIKIQRGSGLDPKSPQFKAAQKACQDLLPGAARDGGTTESEGTP